MNRPFTMTTTTNAMAVLPYAFQTMFGAQLLFGSATLTKFMPAQWVVGLATFWFLGSLVALVASLLAPKLRTPYSALWFEFAGALAIAVVHGVIELALVQSRGFWTNPLTETYVLSFALGGIARAVQIGWEFFKLRKALDCPVISDKPVLADPSDIHHT
jgi:cbb3-type cytochrome oxidase subunit 1